MFLLFIDIIGNTKFQGIIKNKRQYWWLPIIIFTHDILNLVHFLYLDDKIITFKSNINWNRILFKKLHEICVSHYLLVID